MASAPIIATIGDPVTRPVQIAAVAMGAAAVAFSIRQASANHLALCCRGIGWIAILGPLLVLAQLLPLPLSWSHPIWTSAAEVLPELFYGHVTVDVGRTVQSLISIVSLLAVTGIGIVVAHDRQNAQRLHLAASAITTLVALTVLLQKFLPAGAAPTIPMETAIEFIELGVLLNSAIILQAIEHRSIRRKEAAYYLPVGLGGIAALLINMFALYQMADASQWIAVALGGAVLLLLLVIRRLGAFHWTIAVLCVAALIGTGLVITWLFDKNALASGLLRFIPPPPASTLATLQHLIADSRWVGSGANTFDVVARIYQIGDVNDGLNAPTAAVAVAVEAGWVGLVMSALSGLALFTKLFVGALRRGRDWFFAAAAAAAMAVALCSSLVASGPLQLPFALLLAIIVGIGISQGVSQSARH
jgi:hypothetical protein